MRLYWYWPYLRPEHLVLVDAMGALVDELVVHTVAGRIDDGAYERGSARIVATLPEVSDHRERSVAWARSRVATFRERTRLRAEFATNFDVAHVVFANRFTDWRALAPIARDTALVTTVHDALPHESRLPAALERFVLQRLYANAGTLVVHHPSVQRQLVADFGVTPSRVHEVPHWVLPVASEHRAAPNQPPTVLCFGALRRNKGIDVLLTAIERQPDLDIRFVFAGRGAADLETALRTAADADQRIHAEVGYVSAERKDELFRAADLVVLPYTSFASQSGVLPDAYAHGRPVVVSDVGALGESVRADRTGRVVQPNDPDALLDAITDMLADHGEWHTAAAASESIRVAHDPAATAARLLAVYESTHRSPAHR